MGKSAQVPLHVWLPDSMEGPTPISALIHAATMVTAGIFMVARMSPLFELSRDRAHLRAVRSARPRRSSWASSASCSNDIKRVVAYSTLSQLGYMTVALGVSAYGAGIFHLMTHAFFKALLFLAAGSVIIGMHHEQDMRKMGGLRKYMPITVSTFLIGSLALIGTPGFSGFFSKDALIEAVHESRDARATCYAYCCVLLGVFVTALYSFRLLFMTFHGKERLDHHTQEHLHESPWVVTLPLIALAIPSLVDRLAHRRAGAVRRLLQGLDLRAARARPARASSAAEFHGPLEFMLDAFKAPAVYLAAAGALVAWFLDLKPAIARALAAAVLRAVSRAREQVLLRSVLTRTCSRGVAAFSAASSGRSATRR